MEVCCGLGLEDLANWPRSADSTGTVTGMSWMAVAGTRPAVGGVVTAATAAATVAVTVAAAVTAAAAVTEK